jgi:hypothetical protein
MEAAMLLETVHTIASNSKTMTKRRNLRKKPN